jgi:hypothetical protein
MSVRVYSWLATYVERISDSCRLDGRRGGPWKGSLGRRVFNAVQHLEDQHGITVPSYEHFDVVGDSVRRRWQCLFDELNKRYRCGKTTVNVICQPGVFRVNSHLN